MTRQYDEQHATTASFSIPSILAIVSAILSFFAGGILGLILALAAILLGALGVLMAFSPRIRGGMTSIISIFAGAVGIIVAIVKILTLNW